MKKINMRKIMVEAHAKTREFVKLYKVDYKTQLNLFISYLLDEEYTKIAIEKIGEKQVNNYTVEDYKRIAGYIINKSRAFEGIRTFKENTLYRSGNIDINLLNIPEHLTSNVTLTEYYEYENEIISHILEYLMLDDDNKIGDKSFWKYVFNKTKKFLRLEQRRGGVQVAKDKIGVVNVDDFLQVESNHKTYNNIDDFFQTENEKMIELVQYHDTLTEKQALYINARLRDIEEQKILPTRDLFELYGYGKNNMLNGKELNALRKKVNNILIENGYNAIA